MGMEAVAQIRRTLNVSEGRSLLSYLSGDMNTNIRRRPLRKYSWRENARTKILAIFLPYLQEIDRESC